MNCSVLTQQTSPPTASSDVCNKRPLPASHTDDASDSSSEIQKLRKLNNLLTAKYLGNRHSAANKNKDASNKAKAKPSQKVEKESQKAKALQMYQYTLAQRQMMTNPYIAIEETIKRLSTPTETSFQQQLLKMKVLGVTQEKAIENYILFRRGVTPSVTGASSCRSVSHGEPSTQAFASPKTDDLSSSPITSTIASGSGYPHGQEKDTISTSEGYNEEDNGLNTRMKSPYSAPDAHRQSLLQGLSYLGSPQSLGDHHQQPRRLAPEGQNQQTDVNCEEQMVLPPQFLQSTGEEKSALTSQQKQILFRQKQQWQAEFGKWSSEKNRSRMDSASTSMTPDVSRKSSYAGFGEVIDAQPGLLKTNSQEWRAQMQQAQQYQADQGLFNSKSGVKASSPARDETKPSQCTLPSQRINEWPVFSSNEDVHVGNNNTETNKNNKITNVDDFFSSNDTQNTVGKSSLDGEEYDLTGELNGAGVDNDQFIQYYMNLGQETSQMNFGICEEAPRSQAIFDD